MKLLKSACLGTLYRPDFHSVCLRADILKLNAALVLV